MSEIEVMQIRDLFRHMRISRNPACGEIVSKMETFVLQRDVGIPQGMSDEGIMEMLIHISDCPDCSVERDRTYKLLPSNVSVLKPKF